MSILRGIKKIVSVELKRLFSGFKKKENIDITNYLESVGITVNSTEDHGNETFIHSYSDFLIIKYRKKENDLNLMFDVRTDPSMVGQVLKNTSNIYWLDKINILPSFYVDQYEGNMFTGEEAHTKFIEDMSDNIYNVYKEEETEKDFLYNYVASEKVQ